MTCVAIRGEHITIVMCTGDLEAQYHEQLGAECEEEHRRWQDDTDRAFARDAQMTLHDREPELCDARAMSDDTWPPPELNPYEECERDPALVYP